MASSSYVLVSHGKLMEFDTEEEMHAKLEELNSADDAALDAKIDAAIEAKMADYPTKDEVSEMISAANSNAGYDVNAEDGADDI